MLHRNLTLSCSTILSTMPSKKKSKFCFRIQLLLNSADMNILDIVVTRNCMTVELLREEEYSLQEENLYVTQHIRVDNFFAVKYLTNHKEGVKIQT